MRIFVAGAGGYIGLPLCAELLRRGHEVTAFDLWLFRKEPPSGCLKMYGDIRRVGEFGAATDCVIDLAGLSNDAVGDIDLELTHDINVVGAQRLATMAKRAGVRKYIYSSSASVYGHNHKLDLTEDDDCRPLTAYAQSKVHMEDFLRRETDDSFKPIILRNATVFGVSTRMRFDLVVNTMTRAAYVDDLITIDGSGDQLRPLVHIDDVVKAFADCVESEDGPQTKNICAHNHSIVSIASMVSKYFDGVRVRRNKKSAPDARSYHLKPTLLSGKLITDGVHDIVQALHAGDIDEDDPSAWTVRWYRDHWNFGNAHVRAV